MRPCRILAFAALAVLAACSSDSSGGDDPPGGPGSPDAPAAPGTPDAGLPPVGAVSCATEPPAGASTPPPLGYSGGTCPTLQVGMNTLASGGSDRQFLLIVPAGYDGETPLPLFVMWHYLGGDAAGMAEAAQAQRAADMLGMIVAIPEKKGDLTLPVGDFDTVWPYLAMHGADRVEEEASYFDDMVACVSEQFPVNAGCVSTVGVSAGGLWVSQLAHLRAERLASAIVVSGGVAPAPILGFVDLRPWETPARPIPAMVLWGGPTDQCGVDFDVASANLVGAMASSGNFLVECVHNCGHAAPPVEDPVAGLTVLYQFALDHPYWLPAGQSPWLSTGMPAGTPGWCGMGAGSAVPRTGMCIETSADNGCPSL